MGEPGTSPAGENRNSSAHWAGIAIAALAILYALPHVWWMLGVSFLFPGDDADFEFAFQRTWFAVYNVVTTALVLGGAGIVFALERRKLSVAWLRLAGPLVLTGTILLLLRGVIGLLTSLPFIGQSGNDIVPAAVFWEAWFLTSGILYLYVARRHWWPGRAGAPSRS